MEYERQQRIKTRCEREERELERERQAQAEKDAEIERQHQKWVDKMVALKITTKKPRERGR